MDYMLYGRLREQERVRALLDAARDRRSGALLVLGEPGAGKSALLDAARAEARGMAALEARGVQSESRLPYASLYQLLRPALGALERIPRAAGPDSGASGSLQPASGNAVRSRPASPAP